MATGLLALEPGPRYESKLKAFPFGLDFEPDFYWSKGSKLTLVARVYSCVLVPATSGTHSIDP